MYALVKLGASTTECFGIKSKINVNYSPKIMTVNLIIMPTTSRMMQRNSLLDNSLKHGAEGP